MDKAAHTEETHSRPQRMPRLPSHLMDYEVNYPVPGSQPPIASPRSSKHRSSSRRAQSSVSSFSSHSGRRTIHSIGCYPQGLSPIQTAILDENSKQLDLYNLRRQMEEEAQAEQELHLIQSRAKAAQQAQEAAQQAQEEAIEAREAISKRLDQSRRLKQLETDVELAKLVTSMLVTTSTSSSYQPHPSSTASPTPVGCTSPTAHLSAVPPQPEPCSDSVMPHRPSDLFSAMTTDHPPIVVPVNNNIVAPVLPTMAQQHINMSLQQQTTERMVTESAPAVSWPHPSSATTSAPLSSHPAVQPQVVPFYSSPPAPHLTGTNVMHSPMATADHIWEPAPVISYPSQAPLLAPAPYPGLQPQLGADMLIASAFGIPKPTLPVFESGRESDFALLKMALDSLLSNHSHLSEQYKYQVLLSHLKLPSALQLAKAYMHHTSPYTAALSALQDKYGQPRQLIQSELGAILNSPAIRIGDADSFDTLALSIQSLVGMLRTLEGQNGIELRCGSHVDRLLSKLPPVYRDSFVEYCLNRGILQSGSNQTYTLPDLADWLQVKSRAKSISSRAAALYQMEPSKPFKGTRSFIPHKERSTPVLLTVSEESPPPSPAHSMSVSKSQPYCPHCDNKDHYLSSCDNFKKLTPNQIVMWIKDGNRCWKCGRSHAAESCNLKRPCKVCKEQHLTVLHDSVRETSSTVLTVSPAATKVYLDRPNHTQRVMLKVVKILIHHGNQAIEAHAILDDGSERTIVLSPVLQALKLPGVPETLPIQTIHQNVSQLEGLSVSFQISPLSKPNERYLIPNAFSADGLSFAEHNYPIAALQQAHSHLRGLPLLPMDHVQPLLLIGSDMCHLITPIQPVIQGSPNGPVAVHTRLGWCLQGPMTSVQRSRSPTQCLHITTFPNHTKLSQHVQPLDDMQYSVKVKARPRLDQQPFITHQTYTDIDRDSLLKHAPLIPQQAPGEAAQPDFKCPDHYPVMPSTTTEPNQSKIKKKDFISVVVGATSSQVPCVGQSHTWSEHIQVTARSCHGAASPDTKTEPSVYTAAERDLLNQAKAESFPVLELVQNLALEVEGNLNSLGYVLTDSSDPDPVTPNTLLMGRRDSLLPQALYDSENLLRRRQWRHSQVLADNSWSSFVRLHLPGLQARQKWKTDTKELCVGQVVLIADPRFPRASWPVGTVTATFPATDGRVRTATVKVREKTYTHPVIRLIPLPQLTEEDDTAPGSLSADGQLS